MEAMGNQQSGVEEDEAAGGESPAPATIKKEEKRAQQPEKAEAEGDGSCSSKKRREGVARSETATKADIEETSGLDEPNANAGGDGGKVPVPLATSIPAESVEEEVYASGDDDSHELEDDAAAASSSATTKCRNCNKRLAREGCTQAACLNCCDDDGCEKHKKGKEQAIWKRQVLEGTTDIQVMAKRIRSRVIPKKRFREQGFAYAGDTVVIWNLREYLRNPKWREDALRKSSRRKIRSENRSDESKTSPTKVVARTKQSRLASRRRRFRRFIEERYKQSLSPPGIEAEQNQAQTMLPSATPANATSKEHEKTTAASTIGLRIVSSSSSTPDTQIEAAVPATTNGDFKLAADAGMPKNGGEAGHATEAGSPLASSSGGV